MAKFIPLNSVVAEIENRIKSANNDVKIGAIESLIISKTLNGFKSFLDTLEVKEVDLEEEIDLVEGKCHGFESLSRADVIDVAKHFFELGMAVSNKAQKGE